MTALDDSTFAPVLIGLQEVPERTLGWELLAWTADFLRQPDGENAGQPWRFTREQAPFSFELVRRG
ncbi:hypothetical protein [Saccharopolyspora shandongensis]|uniref:hypothetical protein n=1 Tax=Saccharopolyspora shandongensis TaxID=418495 RepID=UPI00115F867A|nr:hypothetical protein [Saccharopolyspora shandongensis]